MTICQNKIPVWAHLCPEEKEFSQKSPLISIRLLSRIRRGLTTHHVRVKMTERTRDGRGEIVPMCVGESRRTVGGRGGDGQHENGWIYRKGGQAALTNRLCVAADVVNKHVELLSRWLLSPWWLTIALRCFPAQWTCFTGAFCHVRWRWVHCLMFKLHL